MNHPAPALTVITHEHVVDEVLFAIDEDLSEQLIDGSSQWAARRVDEIFRDFESIKAGDALQMDRDLLHDLLQSAHLHGSTSVFAGILRPQREPIRANQSGEE